MMLMGMSRYCGLSRVLRLRHNGSVFCRLGKKVGFSRRHPDGEHDETIVIFENPAKSVLNSAILFVVRG